MIILVQGPPCSGKTTLAATLSRSLNIPALSKDDVTEALFRSLGTDSFADSYGAASNEILLLLVQRLSLNSSDMIIESNFDPLQDPEKFRAALKGTEQQIAEIFLNTSKTVLLDRFKKRWDSRVRHFAHRDNLSYGDLETYLDEGPRPISIGVKIVELDASMEHSVLSETALDALKPFLVGK